MTIKLAILDKTGAVKKAYEADSVAYFGFKEAYEEGDIIKVETDTTNNYLVVELDATLNPSLVFVPGKEWQYQVITDTEQTAFHPNSFKGERHYLSVRFAKEYEINQYRNLALNSHDQKEASGAYPHASANVETRNDTTFFARNAIDGMLADESHGSYPYQSWGINQNPDACLRLDFCREVTIDQVALVLRADYPHDSYWTQANMTFSDGSVETLSLAKIIGEQEFSFPKKKITWLELNQLIKAEDESPFPALTQLAVYGTD